MATSTYQAAIFANGFTSYKTTYKLKLDEHAVFTKFVPVSTY
jgi:hypothetical protein